MTKQVNKTSLKIYVTGYYINKQGQRRYGFVKADARKKQTVWVKDLTTLAKYKINIMPKRSLKTFKKQATKYIEKGFKQFRGYKIEKVKRKIKEIDFPVSKAFEIRFDKGKYKRIETTQRYDTIENLESAFYSSFTQGIKLNAQIVVPSITIKVTFTKRKMYTYSSYMFIFARRIKVDISRGTQSEIWLKILGNIRNAISQIKESYAPKMIEFEIKLHWLIEK